MVVYSQIWNLLGFYFLPGVPLPNLVMALLILANLLHNAAIFFVREGFGDAFVDVVFGDLIRWALSSSCLIFLIIAWVPPGR
jgi:hypothetical protein